MTDQTMAGRSLYTRHQRPAGHLVIDWSRPAIELERTVRATDFGPYPNPFGGDFQALVAWWQAERRAALQPRS